MATISVQSIKAQLDDYVDKNRDVISTGVYAGDVQLDKYCKKVTKVKGSFPQFHKIMTRVVQGFKAEWQAMGEMQFNAKMLKNYRQKVNLPIIVDEIYNTWLSELKIEGKTPEEQPITKLIIKELLEKVIDDLSDLSITAKLDLTKFSGQFGFSLDGIAEIFRKGKLNTVNPFYKIPLSAITDANRLDMFKKFERTIPVKTRKKIKHVFCSENMAIAYADAIIEKYGEHTDYNESRTKRTQTFKYEVVGLVGLPDDVIFATVDGNMLKLIDLIDNPPMITDTQVQDYVLKIFMEFHLGYDFAINELVYVADFGATTKAGLGNAAKNKLYYESENLTV